VTGKPEASQNRVGILHYAAPPVVGGVEAVIEAHVRTLVSAGYPVTVIAGRGDEAALPNDAAFLHVPEIDSRHPKIAEITSELKDGEVSDGFEAMTERLVRALEPELARFTDLIVHNAFTKRFNLPLTAALFRLLDEDVISHCIAWCHDVGWASGHSLPNLHEGPPWDLLRTRREDVTYVTVSKARRAELAEVFACAPEEIHVVYNGVDPAFLMGWSEEGRRLIDRLGLLSSDLILLMPVRVTQAKNIELALQVVAALRARIGSVKLVLTGPPDPHDEASMAYFRELQELRRELGVEDAMRFVYESGPGVREGLTIDMGVVADLFRASDLVFMPSHREGFGMPVLEAGLVGKPMVCTEVPAAREIGDGDVVLIDSDGDPEEIADQIVSFVAETRVHRLRRRVRERYTWQAIFERDIQPLFQGSAEA
jgi:glycosyltransferase involved in cell wall biosynthesis